MRDISAEQIVADLQEFKATLLMINAAGIIASYPTQLPFHYQSPYLQGDSLQTIIEACHFVRYKSVLGPAVGVCYNVSHRRNRYGADI